MVLDNLSQQANFTDNISLPRATLERMRQSGDRQLAMINSLLECHFNDVHGILIHPQSIAIGEVIQAAIADLQPLLEKEETKVHLQIPADFPLTHIDSTHICRVFQNLIANAIKHNPPNLILTISAQIKSKDTIVCEVADNGVGMTSEQCEHLFDLYVRGKNQHNLNRRSLSLGLGLYICRQIVQAHGGAIGVTSELNSGSRFWFTLPINLEASTET
jgi:two-component system sensor histidine kinase/response regulator